MFARKLSIQRIDTNGVRQACPIGWIDNFAMRNFTTDPAFADTLPVATECWKQGSACLWMAFSRPWKTGFGARAT